MINWFTLLMVFINVWWVVLFMALPFGASPPEEVKPGHSTGAPAKAHLGKKAAAATVLALIITAIFFYVTSGYLVRPE